MKSKHDGRRSPGRKEVIPGSPPPPPRGFRRALPGALVLLLLAPFALHAPNLRLGLIADDFVFVSQARCVPFLTWLQSTAGISYYRPLSRQVYFGALAPIFGASPVPYHFLSLLLAGMVLLLVAWVGSKLHSWRAGILAAALLAGCHGWSVLTGWASCVQDLLAMALGLGALGLYLRGRGLTSGLLLLLALLSKESALAGLGAMVAVECWGGPRTPGILRRLSWPLALTAAWASAYLLWFRHFPTLNPDPAVDVRADPGAALSSLLFTFLGWVNLDVVPGWIVTPADILSLAAGVGTLALALGMADRSPSPSPSAEAGVRTRAAAAGWTGVSLLLVMAVGHRWSVYLALFPGMGLAWWLGGLLERRMSVAALLVAGLAVLGAFADAPALREGGIPQRGVWSLERLRYLSGFTESLRRDLLVARPGVEPDTRILLVSAPRMSLVALRGSAAARAWYRDCSVRMETIHADTSAGQLEGPVFAMAFDTSLGYATWNPRGASMLRTLDRVSRAGRHDDAAGAAREMQALVEDPDFARQSRPWRAQLLAAFGGLRRDLRDYAGAQELYARALSLDSSEPTATQMMALFLLGAPDPRPAERLARRALEQQPDNPRTSYLYGMAIFSTRREEAVKYLRRSLETGLAGSERNLALRYLAEAGATAP